MRHQDHVSRTLIKFIQTFARRCLFNILTDPVKGMPQVCFGHFIIMIMCIYCHDFTPFWKGDIYLHMMSLKPMEINGEYPYLNVGGTLLLEKNGTLTLKH